MEHQYEHYYIAFIDVLGFRNMIENKTCEEITELYRSIREMKFLHEETADENGKVIAFPIVPREEVHIRVMSDSICICIRADIPGSLFVLTFMCLEFQARMLELDTPVLLRGAITKGKLFSDQDLVFGPAFVKAYLMEEKNASVPRIIIAGETVEEYCKQYPEYEVLKGWTFRDYDGFFALNYIAFYGVASQKDAGRLEGLYFKHIKPVLDSTIDDSIRNKYLYLESRILLLMGGKENHD